MATNWAVDQGHHIPKLTLLEIWPLHPFITPGKQLTVVDVGCNTGLWANAFMNVFGTQVEGYYGVEPLPGNLEVFESRMRQESFPFPRKIDISNMCLGADDSNVEIKFNSDVSTIASVVLDEMQIGNQTVTNDRSMEVKQQKIDSFIKNKNIENIDLLKIDVEGYEWEVINGGENMLRNSNIDLVYFEFGAHQEAVNQSFKMFYDLFKSYGYDLYRQSVSRNFFGIQKINKYDSALEVKDSMWMILASRIPMEKSRNRPFVVGNYNQLPQKQSQKAKDSA